MAIHEFMCMWIYYDFWYFFFVFCFLMIFFNISCTWLCCQMLTVEHHLFFWLFADFLLSYLYLYLYSFFFSFCFFLPRERNNWKRRVEIKLLHENMWKNIYHSHSVIFLPAEKKEYMNFVENPSSFMQCCMCKIAVFRI